LSKNLLSEIESLGLNIPHFREKIEILSTVGSLQLYVGQLQLPASATFITQGAAGLE